MVILIYLIDIEYIVCVILGFGGILANKLDWIFVRGVLIFMVGER